MTARLEMFVRFTDNTGRTLHAVEDTPTNRRTMDRMAAHLMAKENVESIQVDVLTGRTAGYEEPMMTERDTITINGVTFTSWPEHGAWYANEGGVGGVIGTLYAPMKQDGSFDVDDIGEIEVAYADA